MLPGATEPIAALWVEPSTTRSASPLSAIPPRVFAGSHFLTWTMLSSPPSRATISSARTRASSPRSFSS